jgi:hypothetical protein
LEEIAEGIVERLPEFYRAKEKNSLMYDFVESIAKVISQQEKDLNRVKDSHWVDSARGIDLDMLASVLAVGRKRKESDEDFRARIKHTFVDLKKGGTVQAVKAQLAIYLGVPIDEIIVVENPPIEMQLKKDVISGDTWTISSTSIENEKAVITLSLADGEAKDPTIIDTDANLALRFKGTLKKGDILEIQGGKAKLNGIDATGSISVERSGAALKTSDSMQIPRKPAKWIFKERLTDTLGRFDESRFDENVFFKFVSPTSISLKWTARLLAAFEVKVQSKVLTKSDLTKQELEALVNAIKAAGIRTFVTIMPDIEDNLVTVEEKKPEKSKSGASAKMAER